jgi:uncharacterized YccA/Bax inhibitor family protein
VTATTYSAEAADSRSTGPSNPALNPQAFQRGWAQAAPDERIGMTVAGTYIKTAALVIILFGAAMYGWSQVDIVDVRGVPVAVQPAWTWLLVFVTLALGIYGAVALRAAAIVAPLYALAEGTLLGIAAHFYNLEYDGIVLQAILATVAVFAATLVLYSLGKFRVSGRAARFVLVGLLAVFLIWLVAFVLSLFGVNLSFLYQPTPIGIALSLLVVVIGVLNLPMNYEFIEMAAAQGAPKFMEWYAAFGLLLALIWMYLAILRLLRLAQR